ncbi:MAG: hypothetical protein AB1705_24595 [Verrucomicrobiota bacterium]
MKPLTGLLLVFWLGAFTGCARFPSDKTAPSTVNTSPPRFVLAWGKKGEGPGEFRSPIGIAISRQDEIFIAEFNANRVQKFDSSGKFLAQFPVVDHPGGIAVGKDGRLYVTSMLHPAVYVYDSYGNKLLEWGKLGTGDCEFDQPGGLAIGPDGTLYVADQGNHRVQRFTLDGGFLECWGGHGREPGRFGGGDKPRSRFGGPHFLAFDRQGNVYTTESHDGRIQKLTADGKPLLAWGDNSDGPGGFGGRPKSVRNPLLGPIGVCVDSRGRVWVGATNNRIQLFTTEGKYLLGFGGEGEQPGQFRLPHAMAMDSKGFVYVVDASNQRIQKFAP